MATHERKAVLDDIAKTMRGKMKVARVIGQDSGIMVKAYDPTKRVFLESHDWPPHPDIRDQFALHLEGRGYVELGIETAGDTATIAPVQWEPLSHYEVLEKSQTNKEGDIVTLGGMVEVDLNHLQWILKKHPKGFGGSPKGLLMATIPGLLGEYRVYLRGNEIEQLRTPTMEEAILEALAEADAFRAETDCA